jgi:hypothetical protein
MKKILFCLIIFFGSLFADTCIPTKHSDPVTKIKGDSYSFTQAIDDIEDAMKTKNDKVKDIWKKINDNQSKEILNDFKDKKRLLTNMQNLSREDDITETNQLHEIELKRELDGLLIDAWSVE